MKGPFYRLGYLKESLRTLKTTGTVTPSSPSLVSNMASHVDFKTAKNIVELGGGDGAITRQLLKRMSPDARLMVFEVNPSFCEILRAIADNRLIVVEDSAERLNHYLKLNDWDHADYILSAIPFVMLPQDLSYRIIRGCLSSLKDKGRFIQFHYSLFIKKMYQEIFGNVKAHFVLWNFPPAFVFVSEKI